MHKISSFFTSKVSINLIEKIAFVFNKLPHLPKIVLNIFVFIMPWLALLGAVLGVITGPLMAVLSLLSLVTLDVMLIAGLFFSTVIVLLNTYVLMKAFKPLRKKEFFGWIYIFWGNLIGLLSSIYNNISETVTWQNWLVTLGLTLLSFYLLFEIKKYYQGAGNVNSSSSKNNKTIAEILAKQKLQGKDFA